MSGVPTSTSSRRAGKKGFSRPTPTRHLPKIPRLWATELSVGESGVLDSSGVVSSRGVSSSQPREILPRSIHAAGTDKVHKRHARNTSPSHTPASSATARPLVAVTPARTHPPFTHVPAASPGHPSTHCGSRSPSHARTITTPRPPADRNADPVAPAWARLSGGRHPDRTLSSEPAGLGPGSNLPEVGRSSQHKGPWAA